jgi:hypothetical protein
MRFNIILILLSLLVLSCNQNKSVENIDPGYDYYPIEKGRYVIYDVKKINYNLIGKPDTLNYQLKEVIGDTNSSVNSSSFTYRLNRYKRLKSTDLWSLDSVWSCRINSNVLIVNENGEDFVKLSFPVKNALKWNGNTFNAKETDSYEIRQLGNKAFVNGAFYQSSLVVLQNDSLPLNFVNRDYRTEIYSKNIGMIYKESQLYIYKQSTIGNFDIETGTKYIQQISSYGKE